MSKNEAKKNETQENEQLSPEEAAKAYEAAQENSNENADDTTEKELTAEDYKAVIEDLNDKVLRAAADAQNVKRRADIDIQKARAFSIESFAKDVIGVLDNLYRASESVTEEEAAKDEKLKAIKDGVEITKKEMINALERNGIKRIDPTGEKFNPDFHQAMQQIEQEGVEAGNVINTMQAGYTIKERVIRPALVIVAK